MTAPLHNLWMISSEPYFNFPPFQRTDMPLVPYCLRLELYTDSVFWYEPFGIPVFSYQIPKGNSVGKFGILKLAGAPFSQRKGGGFGPLLYTSPSFWGTKGIPAKLSKKEFPQNLQKVFPPNRTVKNTHSNTDTEIPKYRPASAGNLPIPARGGVKN